VRGFSGVGRRATPSASLFEDADMRIEDEKRRLDVHKADLSGSRFENVNLSGCDYRNINMSGCSFDDLNMSGWRVHNVNLAGLRIDKANLAGASISGGRVGGMTIDGISVAELLAYWREGHAANPEAGAP
jgi:uncharacterized protein YjbI with pentapeptide repeats